MSLNKYKSGFMNISNDPLENLAILGATGSIGDSTLDIVRLHPDKYCVYALSGFYQIDKLLALCREFLPKMVCVADDYADQFRQRLDEQKLDIELLTGADGLNAIASADHVDTVVAAIVGAAGLSSTLSAVNAGKRILLANKESLVMAGHLVMSAAKKSGAVILPIDSEHNAIYQCLPAQIQINNHAIHNKNYGIKKLWLTASGGSFLHKSYQQMQNASIEEAIKHPNWSMGKKISIDSATMMNKGLELIEACYLFDLPEECIGIVIHPDSVVHSLVEYVDGSFLAHLGSPDMKTPIAHAMSYPHRISSGVQSLDLYDLAALSFIKPDENKFTSLALARFAARRGVGACITLNAANEVAVSAFLDGKIRLTDIAFIVHQCLEDDVLKAHFDDEFLNIDEIFKMDKKVRNTACAYIAKGVI